MKPIKSMSLLSGTHGDTKDEICEISPSLEDQGSLFRGLGANSDGQPLQQRNQHQTLFKIETIRGNLLHHGDHV